MLICKLARTTSVILVDLELDCIGTVSLLSCASFHDRLSSFHFAQTFCEAGQNETFSAQPDLSVQICKFQSAETIVKSDTDVKKCYWNSEVCGPIPQKSFYCPESLEEGCHIKNYYPSLQLNSSLKEERLFFSTQEI